MKPRIAIPSPTSYDLGYNRMNFCAYADAVRASGGEPVEISQGSGPKDTMRIAAGCDGLLLPGSPADVDPTWYGQERGEASAAPDHPREQIDRLLLEEAYARRKPILGVCFGLQMLNVFRGGTLIQDVTVKPVNHSAGRAVGIAHQATIGPDSLLGSIVDSLEALGAGGRITLPVNSSHHQAVGIAGLGLEVSARCPQDGVVEALESSREPEGQDAAVHFVLGVQWHPERTFASSVTSKKIFTRFLAEATAYGRTVALATLLAH